jgi:ABC-type amino acid transport substrate-binding protein
VRIAAVGGTAPEPSLTARLRRAQVVRVAPNPAINPELVALLTAGQVDALANNRATLLGLAAQVPGARVLADRYAVQQQWLTLPPGRSAARAARGARRVTVREPVA